MVLQQIISTVGSLVEADILALAASIQELSAGSRRARTGMWCALVVTLLKQEEEEYQKSKMTGIADVGEKADTVCTTSATANTTVSANATAVTSSVTIISATTTTASAAPVGK